MHNCKWHRAMAGTVAAAAMLMTLPALAADDAQRTVVTGYNATAIKLALELSKAGVKGNLVLSPLSIGSAMAMTLTGARGKTEQEMAKVLSLTLPRDQLDAANAALLAALNKPQPTPPAAQSAAPQAQSAAPNEQNQQPATPAEQNQQPAAPAAQAAPPVASPVAPVRLIVANGLFLTSKTNYVSQDYTKLIHDKYAGEVFVGADLAKINGWVAEKTDKKIEKILESLSANSAAVLLNAVYFKAPWAEPFRKELTKDDDFHLTASEQVKVPMMMRAGRYATVSGDGFKALRLPYSNPALGMVVVVPDDVNGIAALSTKLDAKQVTDLLNGLATQAPSQLTLSLPRFKVSSEADLIPPFEQMGMKLPFSADSDFGGITGSTAPEGLLSIGQIKHRAVVEVTEEGTEAAAATAVEIFARSAQRPDQFRVDRPFLFFIADKSTGAILFQGRVVDPR